MQSSSRTRFPYGTAKARRCMAVTRHRFLKVCRPWKMQLKLRGLGSERDRRKGSRGRWGGLSSVNVDTGLDYLKPRWVILFYWLLELDEAGPMLPQVSPILQLIICSRHWVHYPLLLKADLVSSLSISVSFDILSAGLSAPMRWPLGRPPAGLPKVLPQLQISKLEIFNNLWSHTSWGHILCGF